MSASRASCGTTFTSRQHFLRQQQRLALGADRTLQQWLRHLEYPPRDKRVVMAYCLRRSQARVHDDALAGLQGGQPSSSVRSLAILHATV